MTDVSTSRRSAAHASDARARKQTTGTGARYLRMAAEDGAGGMTRQAGSVEVRSTDSDLVIAARGPWTVQWMAALDQRMAAIKPGAARRARFDLSDLDALDSAGAWLIARTRGQLAAAGL